MAATPPLFSTQAPPLSPVCLLCTPTLPIWSRLGHCQTLGGTAPDTANFFEFLVISGGLSRRLSVFLQITTSSEKSAPAPYHRVGNRPREGN